MEKQEDTKFMGRNCQEQLGEIRKLGTFSEEELSFIELPKRSLSVIFPVKMDTGKVRSFRGYRVQHNDVLGPTKGGIRIHPDTSLEEITELAFLMSLKTSLVNLPYGGAKGAIKADPRKLSAKEFERVVREYTRQIAKFIGPDTDIPAPDVNTNSEMIAVMLDEYEKIVGHKEPTTFTGKPFALGGSLGRETSTAKGGYYIIKELLKKERAGEVKVAIQGFGNVGMNLAELLYEDKFKVVAVSDSSTGLYKEDGLDIPSLASHKRGEGKLARRPEKKISNNKVLGLEVDLLAPSALGNVITKRNAGRIKAKTIIEMANAPINPGAYDVLKGNKIDVIPDILANSGGVIVSYFEWMQNKAGEQWTAKKVDEKLRDTILSAYGVVKEESDKRPKLDMRTVGYILAIKRIIEAEKERLG